MRFFNFRNIFFTISLGRWRGRGLLTLAGPTTRPPPKESSRTQILATTMMPTFALPYFAFRLTSKLLLANSYTRWIVQSLIDFDYVLYWHGMLFRIKFFLGPEILFAGPTLSPSSVVGWTPLVYMTKVKGLVLYMWK